MTAIVLHGDCRELLATLDAGSVQTCVTSPPYFGLRDYGVAGQIGLEATPDAYVAELVAVFREVRRVLSDDATLWLNLGDSYHAGQSAARGSPDRSTLTGGGGRYRTGSKVEKAFNEQKPTKRANDGSTKPKDLLGIPWRVAFALQADGWYLRSDIIWHKPNPMPESVTDRPTKSHEYLFLLAKSERYYYDADAIAEPAIHAGRIVRATDADTAKNGQKGEHGATAFGFTQHDTLVKSDRNRRTVWTIPTAPYRGAHFATFPPALIEPCILAGSKRGDTVLDPFGGAGTTGLVADRLGRNAVLCELNPAYATMARHRITDDSPLFADGAA